MMNTLPFLILLFVGVCLLCLGVSGSLGYRRLTYILPNYYSGGINYASIPLGIVAIIGALAVSLSLSNTWVMIFRWASIGLVLLGLLLNFLQPWFLEPGWYRWLKAKHGDIMPWLQQDVERMGYRQWCAQTETIADLDKWAIEVRQKYAREIAAATYYEGTKGK